MFVIVVFSEFEQSYSAVVMLIFSNKLSEKLFVAAKSLLKFYYNISSLKLNPN